MIDTWRYVYVRVHKRAFRQWMAYRGESVRSLAAKTKNPPVSRSMIGHMLTGTRSTCSPEVARSVEKSLDVPPGTIFEPTVCGVQQPTTRRATA